MSTGQMECPLVPQHLDNLYCPAVSWCSLDGNCCIVCCGVCIGGRQWLVVVAVADGWPVVVSSSQ